jgi:hypothetical protein
LRPENAAVGVKSPQKKNNDKFVEALGRQLDVPEFFKDEIRIELHDMA